MEGCARPRQDLQGGLGQRFPGDDAVGELSEDVHGAYAAKSRGAEAQWASRR